MFNLSVFVTIVFLAFQMSGMVEWSWLFVFSPILIFFLTYGIVSFVIIALLKIGLKTKNKNVNKFYKGMFDE